MKEFYLSHFVTALGLILAYMWGGWEAVTIALLLIIMEVSLSFDNAVVNATVLKDMDEIWQRRFLTWGILIAVFGMRLIFPMAIVAFATGLGVWEVGMLALNSPEEYSAHVLASHEQIAAFGGMFLLMVFLKFICDSTRDIFWIGIIESKLAALGKLEAAEVILALIILLVLSSFVAPEHQLEVLFAGVVGVVLFVATTSMTSLFGDESNTSAMAHAGLMGFIYLQFLDASFSLDGVVGAFAMSRDVVIIMLGLGVGAMFVRSLTVYLVHRGTLDQYVYLEHGAHWGIGALAGIMLMNTMMHIPEVVTGLVGAGLVGLSLLSSIRYNRINGKN